MPIIPLATTALIVGVLGTCLVVTHLKAPINPNRLHAAVHTQLKSSKLSRHHGPAAPPLTASGNDEVFIASRAAIRATNHAYNLRTVLDALLQPQRSADYTFHKEVYRRGPTGSLEFTRSLGGEIMEGNIDPEGTGDKEPDVWNPDDQGQETTRTELEDILLVNLPVLLVFAALFCAVEIAAMLARRGRDWMLQSGLSKLSDATFRAQACTALPSTPSPHTIHFGQKPPPIPPSLPHSLYPLSRYLSPLFVAHRGLPLEGTSPGLPDEETPR
jgi:hypothetical protein